MNFSRTPEQQLFVDGAARYLQKNYDFTARTRIIASAPGYGQKIWREFGEMGWLGLPFPEEYGGSGGTMLDVMLLSKVFGRHLVIEPYLSSVVLGGMTILLAGNADQKKQFLPLLSSGTKQISLAFAEPRSGYDSFDVSTVAKREGNGFRLDGRKAVVMGAPSSDQILIAARTAGNQRDRSGISLFIVDRTARGVGLRSYQTIDGRRAAEVALDSVHVGGDALIGDLDSGHIYLEEALMAGRLAVIGEAVGALHAALDQTIDYLKIREQFGKKLSTYQALRHRIADMFILTNEMDALGNVAADAFLNGKADDRLATICGAKAYIGEEGRWVAENAIQLHGAIAIADENMVGHFLKRMIAIDRLFGDVEHNLNGFMDKTVAFA